MIDPYTPILNISLKITYLIPFFVFYLLSQRINSVISKKRVNILRLGIILTITNIVILLVTNLLIAEQTLPFNQLDDLNIYQIIINAPLLLGYFFLFKGMQQLSPNNKKNSSASIYSTLVITLLSVMILVILKDSLLLALNLITYYYAIIYLSASFVIAYKKLSGIKERFSIIVLIGAFAIILDPAAYTHLYVNILTDTNFDTVQLFLNNRIYVYIGGLIGSILVLIPNILFFNKLRKSIEIKMTPNDTIIEYTLKRLLNETQKIYGEAVMNLFDNTCSSYLEEEHKYVDFSPELNLKNLDSIEQKKFFGKLLNLYFKIIPAELGEKILDKIADIRNSKLINDSIPDKIILLERIEPDDKQLKTKRKQH